MLLHRFDPLAVAQALERYRVSWWYSIAPMNVALMQVPGVEKMDFSALRRNTVTSFGITYTEDLAQKWRRFAPNAISSEGLRPFGNPHHGHIHARRCHTLGHTWQASAGQ